MFYCMNRNRNKIKTKIKVEIIIEKKPKIYITELKLNQTS